MYYINPTPYLISKAVSRGFEISIEDDKFTEFVNSNKLQSHYPYVFKLIQIATGRVFRLTKYSDICYFLSEEVLIDDEELRFVVLLSQLNEKNKRFYREYRSFSQWYIYEVVRNYYETLP